MIRISFLLSLTCAAPLPALGPGETKKIQIVLPGYWMYDPNAHFTIELDFDNNIDEKEESNNSVTVFEWG